MNVLTWPDPRLAQPAAEVPEGERCRELIDTLYDAMDYPNGIGIAAPQIGVMKQIICIRVPPVKRNASGDTKLAIINPKLIWWKGGPTLGWEGCLSFPDKQVLVPRPHRIKVSGFDVRWKPIVIGGKDLVARVLMHEMDHLRGVTLAHYAQVNEELKRQEDEKPT